MIKIEIAEHINQYEYNEKVIEWCQSSEFPYYDWVIIITFYSALHKIDCCLHQIGLTDRDITSFRNEAKYGHQARNYEVMLNFKEIKQDYITLYTECRKLRYDQYKLNDISKEDLESFINIWYNKIKPFSLSKRSNSSKEIKRRRYKRKI
ncbi:hypothetical protein LCGC14_1817130 [marine sediment metagenome]|uniref:HEPN domain-containing protein n=1 Tax=marine sediment metagenome TaxID=412755 RepID=A0A0F9H821_9ZZZZ|nr:hypothetical protein [bacterium]